MTGMSASDGTVQRGSWGRATEFFFTMLGFAVGLANVWRFPNVVYEFGGGAFFIPYIIAIIVIGMPLFLMESSIGQYSRKNSIEVWDINPPFRGLGLASAFIVTNINIYYTTPQAWGLFYFIKSMASTLPWDGCHEPWATPNCTNVTAAEEFFYQGVVKVSSGLTDWGTFNWELMLCNMGIWIIIFAATCYGAASLGKVAYFTSTFPYLMLTAMLIYTLTLKGSSKGVEYYLEPDIAKLNDIRVWSVAVSQVFFSTGLGCGVVPQLSSYNRFDHHLLRDSFLVPASDALTSFFAGFSVFAVLGYMADVKNVKVEKVVEAGPGLIFVTYPEAFLTMPGGQVWAVFFFFMVCILGLSSSVPSVECTGSILSDYIPWFKKSRMHNIILRFIICAVQFAMGIFFFFGNGFYSYSLIDDRVIGYSLMIIGICETLALAWFFGPKRLVAMVDEMIGGWDRCQFVQYFFMISWLVICPAGLFFIFILDVIDYVGLNSYTVLSYDFPDWGIAIGWVLVGITPLLIVGTAIYELCFKHKIGHAIFKATQPSQKWQKRDDAHGSTDLPSEEDEGILPAYTLYPDNSIHTIELNSF